jgi:hypothetical protein
MKKIIGKHEFELRETLLISQGEKYGVRPFDLINWIQKVDFEDETEVMKNFGEFKDRLEPLIKAIIADGPDLGQLTYGEYFQLIEPAINALNRSFQGMETVQSKKVQ